LLFIYAHWISVSSSRTEQLMIFLDTRYASYQISSQFNTQSYRKCSPQYLRINIY